MQYVNQKHFIKIWRGGGVQTVRKYGRQLQNPFSDKVFANNVLARIDMKLL